MPSLRVDSTRKLRPQVHAKPGLKRLAHFRNANYKNGTNEELREALPLWISNCTTNLGEAPLLPWGSGVDRRR